MNAVTRLRLILLAVALTVFAGFAVRGAPSFDLDSTASTYPFVTRLVGTFTERGDSLVILVESGIVRSQIPRDIGADGVVNQVTIEFGLGRQESDVWEWEHETEPQLVADTLRPGQTWKIGNLRFVITGLDTVPLAERWLVAQVGVQQHLPMEGLKAGLLTSYACAETNLRGATPSSRVRARGMKSRYSTIC